MLTIRTEQMGVFQEMAEDEFLNRLATYIGHTEPTAGPPLSPDTLQSMVRTGIRRARGHELTWQSNIAAFVVLMFQLGPSYDTWPAFAAILDDPAIPPEQRMNVLAEQATSADLDGVARQYDMSAWFSF